MRGKETKSRGKDGFRSFAHASKGFLLYQKYPITWAFLHNQSFLHSFRLQFGFVSLQFHILVYLQQQSVNGSAEAYHPQRISHFPPRSHHQSVRWEELPSKFHRAHSFHDPSKAFAFALKLSQQCFPCSELCKHMGSTWLPYYLIPGQSSVHQVTDLAHQQWLCPCSEPL